MIQDVVPRRRRWARDFIGLARPDPLHCHGRTANSAAPPRPATVCDSGIFPRKTLVTHDIQHEFTRASDQMRLCCTETRGPLGARKARPQRHLPEAPRVAAQPWPGLPPSDRQAGGPTSKQIMNLLKWADRSGPRRPAGGRAARRARLQQWRIYIAHANKGALLPPFTEADTCLCQRDECRYALAAGARRAADRLPPSGGWASRGKPRPRSANDARLTCSLHSGAGRGGRSAT